MNIRPWKDLIQVFQTPLDKGFFGGEGKRAMVNHFIRHQKPGYLGVYMGSYTTQLYGHYTEPFTLQKPHMKASLVLPLLTPQYVKLSTGRATRVARNPSWLIDISGSRCHLGFLHSPLENIPWESDETPPLLCLNLPKINLGEMKCQSWSLRKKTIWKNSAIYLHPSFAPGESVVAATACFLLLMVSRMLLLLDLFGIDTSPCVFFVHLYTMLTSNHFSHQSRYHTTEIAPLQRSMFQPLSIGKLKPQGSQ